jgi:cytoskeletal protein CcmA (bactofilin family)
MGFDPIQTKSVAVIGTGMRIQGEISSGEHVHVDGEIDGTLRLPGYDLRVTAQARVRADVTAREADIAGVLEGNIDAAKKITVRKGGRLLGDLRTPGITIEDGAYFKGKIEIVNSQMEEEPAVVAASSTTAAAAG